MQISKDEGATLACGGEPIATSSDGNKGFFMAPALFSGKRGQHAHQQGRNFLARSPASSR